MWARLRQGLEERRAEMQDLETRIADAATDKERSRLQTRLAEVRAEYLPSDRAQRRLFF